MKHVIDNQFVLSRAPEGPLAAWLDGFPRFSSAKGYAVGTIQRRLVSAARFSGWLQQERIEPSNLTVDHPARYRPLALEMIVPPSWPTGSAPLLRSRPPNLAEESSIL